MRETPYDIAIRAFCDTVAYEAYASAVEIAIDNLRELPSRLGKETVLAKLSTWFQGLSPYDKEMASELVLEVAGLGVWRVLMEAEEPPCKHEAFDGVLTFELFLRQYSSQEEVYSGDPVTQVWLNGLGSAQELESHFMRSLPDYRAKLLARIEAADTDSDST